MLLDAPVAADIRTSVWLPALRVLAAIAAVAMALPVVRDAALVYGPPLTEDGYYALTVARNLAHGHGMTIDGTTLSNGFQPLFTVVEALAFLLGRNDDVFSIRLVFAFAWIFHVGGALLCGAIAREIWPARDDTEAGMRATLATIFYLGSPLLFGHAYNGLATGCVLFFYLATIRWIQVGGAGSGRGRVVLGALIGLMVLARIDAAFFAVAIGLHLLWTNRAAGPAVCLTRAAGVTLTALAVSGPWWAYNILDFGSFLPTSGEALKSTGISPARAHYALWALRAVLMPWLFFGQLDDYVGYATSLPRYWGFGYISAASSARLLLLVAAAGGLWRFARGGLARDLASLRDGGNARARRGLAAMALLLAAVVSLIVYYTFFFGSYWFYYRYFMPLAILPFLVAPIACARMLMAAGSARRLAAIAIAAIAAQAVVWPALALNGRTFNPEAVYFDQVALVAANVPADAPVAAGQSGTLGYFRPHVINTDGKVNIDALHFNGRISEYLRRRGVRWYVDWPYYVNRHLGVPLDPATGEPALSGNGWRYVAQRNGFYLYTYEPSP